MSDPSRGGGAELRISRSHLWAAGSAACVFACFTFFFGVAVGKRSARETAASAVSVAEPDGRLIELLARIEANAEPSGGSERLTFPDVLEGSVKDPEVPEAMPRPRSVATVDPGFDDRAPGAEDPVEGAFSIRIAEGLSKGESTELWAALKARGLPVTRAYRRVDGEERVDLFLGSWSVRESALEARRRWRGELEAMGLYDGAQITAP